MIAFTIPGPPKAKERPRTSFFDKHGRRRKKPVTYTPTATKNYEAKIKDLCLEGRGRGQKIDGPVDMVVIVREDGVYVEFRPTGEPTANVSVDLDNVVKACADACNGVAYDDDRQIVSIQAVIE